MYIYIYIYMRDLLTYKHVCVCVFASVTACVMMSQPSEHMELKAPICDWTSGLCVEASTRGV